MESQGEIQLSNGFFQMFISGNHPSNIEPVLQIMESRVLPDNGVIRLRLSDGLFSYASCAGSPPVREQLDQQGYSNSNGIIQVTAFNRSTVSGKVAFNITSFTPLMLTGTIIGEPKPHSGNPDEYKGIENFQQILGQQSPSRKRIQQNDGPVPNKRQMAPGGLFSGGLLDVSLINPYSSKFRFRGVVTSKEPTKSINTKRGASSVFSFVIADDKGDSIKVTGFGNECEKFSELVQNGGAYYVTCSGSNMVRPSNARFNSTGHTYEIVLNPQCEIEVCNDQDVKAPPVKLHVVHLADMKNHSGKCIDILAVVERVDDVIDSTSRTTGKELKRRHVIMVDESCVQAQMTLWNEGVDAIDQGSLGNVLGIKGASVREFNGGFSLSINPGTPIITAPEGELTNRLYQWFLNERPNAQVRNISTGGSSANFGRDCRLINCIKETNLDATGGNGMSAVIEAMIQSIKTENIAYTACIAGSCKKKVTGTDNNQWLCSSCGVQDSHRWLYMLSMEVSDISGLTWVTLFDETATSLLGKSADEMMRLQVSDRPSYDSVLHGVRFKNFEFRLRIKDEMYNDQKRKRWNCLQVRQMSADRYIEALRKSLAVLD